MLKSIPLIDFEKGIFYNIHRKPEKTVQYNQTLWRYSKMLEKLIDLFWSGVSILLALGIAGGVSFFIWAACKLKKEEQQNAARQ